MPTNKPSKRPYTRFDLQDYIDHPAVVKKANDAAFEYFETVLDDNTELQALVKAKERIELLNEARDRSIFGVVILQIVLQICVPICIGFGVNLLTQSPSDSDGILLIGIAIVLEIIALISILIAKSRRGNR